DAGRLPPLLSQDSGGRSSRRRSFRAVLGPVATAAGGVSVNARLRAMDLLAVNAAPGKLVSDHSGVTAGPGSGRNLEQSGCCSVVVGFRFAERVDRRGDGIGETSFHGCVLLKKLPASAPASPSRQSSRRKPLKSDARMLRI